MCQLEEAHARALKAEEALELSQRQSLVSHEAFWLCTSPVPILLIASSLVTVLRTTYYSLGPSICGRSMLTWRAAVWYRDGYLQHCTLEVEAIDFMLCCAHLTGSQMQAFLSFGLDVKYVGCSGTSSSAVMCACCVFHSICRMFMLGCVENPLWLHLLFWQHTVPAQRQ